MHKKLVLEDGLVFEGRSFGSDEDVSGEVIFSTAMTDYQGLLTDPSICGQIVCMTFPLIGNYGINRFDSESLQPWIGALLVRELCDAPNNFRMESKLNDYLVRNNIPGLEGIDTRMLTRHLREKGALKGIIVSSDVSVEDAIARLHGQPTEDAPVSLVSAKVPYRIPGSGKRVVVIDYGMKASMAEALSKKRYDVTVLPWDTSAEAVLELKPDGVLLSNGPGDPLQVEGGPERIRELLGKVPVFGICMGHQLLCLALGAKSMKMKSGHHGGNYPVRNLETGKIMMTSQGHGFVIDADSLEGTGLVPTYLSVNDGTLEGVRHESLPATSVQFHPEASPGPHDAANLFDQFDKMMEKHHA